jgi:predicted nuclease with RNAse H fold
VTVVCGIDVGSLQTSADVAWLADGAFSFARYVPSAASPLPAPPPALDAAVCFALDAPQSLPVAGSKRREADRLANTPTRLLPTRRVDVAAMRAYGPFVEAGLTLFWEAHLRSLPVVETYPRFVIRTLWPELKIPSKRRDSKRYIAEIWARLRTLGYSSRPPGTHDEIDAMLCALAAEAFASGAHVQVGAPLLVDVDESVLREGFIVAPAAPGASAAAEIVALQVRSYAGADSAFRGAWPPERAMDAGEVASFLGEQRYCVFTTTTARGHAQARPVNFSLFDGSFWIASVGGGRLRNLQRTPWASLVVMDGAGEAHRAVVVDGPVSIHDRAPAGVAALWEERHASRPEWAVAWIELRPGRLLSYRGSA